MALDQKNFYLIEVKINTTIDSHSSRKIAEIFLRFAERECKSTSKVYYQLATAIAQEESLLQLANHRRNRQPIPNLFLGAIHYLLLKNPEEKLAAFYPSINPKTSSPIPIELLKELCQRRRAEIIELLQTRIVQTNAINRTAYLMPILSAAFPEDTPINLVDIGTSSGLTMNFDQYQYNYNDLKTFGKSRVIIRSKIIEGVLPKFKKIISVKRKIGIDQNPLDLTIEDNALWLKALIWPDLRARFLRIKHAIALRQTSNLQLVKANTISAFKSILLKLPKDEPLVVYHTHVLYQFNPKERQEFRAMLDEIGQERNFKYLAAEGNSIFDRIDYLEKVVLVELTTYQAGKKESKVVAQTDGHATWIKWK